MYASSPVRPFWRTCIQLHAAQQHVSTDMIGQNFRQKVYKMEHATNQNDLVFQLVGYLFIMPTATHHFCLGNELFK